MSFNVSTRLNNIQNQINQIVNSGLTNPLQGPMDVNSKLLNNVNIIDGGPNSVQIRTSNAGGIILDNPLFSTTDITVDTLHYKALDPPINYNSISYTLIGSQTVEPTEGNINMFNDNPNSGFISQQSLVSPSLSCSIIMVSSSGSNSISIGFSSSSTATTPSYGVYWYPEEGIIQSIGGTSQIPYSLATLNLDLLVVGNKLKYYVNSVEQPTLEITIPNVAYYLNCYAYVGTEIQVQNIGFVISHAQTLEDVLSTGNDGGGQNITGVGALTCGTLNYTTLNPPIPTASTPSISQVLTAGSIATNQDLSGINNLTCTTLKYTSLSPVPPSQWVGTATSNLNMSSNNITNLSEIDMVGAESSTVAISIDPLLPQYLRYTTGQWVENGEINYGNIYDSKYNKPTLTSVLTGGNDGGNQDITNVKDLTVSKLNYTTLNPPIPTATIPTLNQVLTAGADAGNLSITGINNLFASDLISNVLVLNYGTAGSNFQIFGGSDQLAFQQYKGSPSVLTNQPIIITDLANITFNTDELILKDSQILDSKYATPTLKQYIDNEINTIDCYFVGGISRTNSLSFELPSTTNYPINYAEILFNNLSITFFRVFDTPTPSSTITVTIYLSETSQGSYDSSKGNCITINFSVDTRTYIFDSTIPILLTYLTNTPIAKIYCVYDISGWVDATTGVIYTAGINIISGTVTGQVCNKTPFTITYY